jgi:hypothetical protein
MNKVKVRSNSKHVAIVNLLDFKQFCKNNKITFVS